MPDQERELVLDEAHFRRIVSESASEDTAQQLADAYTTQVSRVIGELNNCLAKGTESERTARGLLHRLQGSAEIIGASRLSRTVRRLLEKDQHQFYTHLQASLPALQETAKATVAAITAIVQ